MTAFRLYPERTIDLLGACAGREVLKPGILIAPDLAFWVTAMRFAGALAARQQFLPDVTKEEDGYHARWTPVMSGAEAERLHQLARAMPDAARALSFGEEQPAAIGREDAVSCFVGSILDFVVRHAHGFHPQAALARVRSASQNAASESLHDEWLRALHSSDSRLKGDAAQLARFAAAAKEWQRPISLSAMAPFRLCFRLEEPPEMGDGQPAENGGGRWHVRYLLQSVTDPSLLLEASEAWKPRGKAVSLLHEAEFDAREYLLRSLGQCSAICPYIEASLKAATPGGYELDAAGAYEFLNEKALALEQSGFGVMLPAWWTRKGTRLRLAARALVKSPNLQASAGLSLDDLVGFEWQVALGEEKLTLGELEALAELKLPLVRRRGQWVELSAEQLRCAIDAWKQRASGTATVREIMRLALGGGASEGARTPVEFEGVTATGWVGELLARLESRSAFEELPAPDGFRGTLRPYQVRGYSWLRFLCQWGLGACLADDMGLGKTVQALALVEHLRRLGARQPVLLICPMSVVENWHKEAARFTPHLPVWVHHGGGRIKGASFREQAEKHALVVSSYALLQRDFHTLGQVTWSGIILDEAQNVKNPETKQARAARSLPAGYRIALTGTPVENNVGDLWSLMEFLNPGFLGTQAEFKRRFFVPIQAARDQEAAERLKRLTGPFILRRLKTDKSIIADLPEKNEMKVFCMLTREQGSLYAAVVKEASRAIESAEGIQRKGVVLATLSKLKQVCNHPAQFLGDNSPIPGRSGKLARLGEMLEEVLEAGDHALIFTQFAAMGEILRRHLEETFGRETLFLHGGVPRKQRDVMVERFQQSDGPRLFVLSLKAGGTGLNLTAAHHVFHFDRWWNPAVENQATDRAFRIGQSRNVQVHKFLCAGTLEEKIDEMIERKKQVVAGVVGSGEAWLTELSTAELKQLLALSQEAVEA